MPRDPVHEDLARRARVRRMQNIGRPQQASHTRIPSASGYMVATSAAAGALFFLLWWMLNNGGDDAPWIPAGLAASVVMLVGVAAREVVMRRAWTRYLLETERQPNQQNPNSIGTEGVNRTRRHRDSATAKLRALRYQCEEANLPGALPEAHLDAFLSCQEYLEHVDDRLRSTGLDNSSRVTLRASQERVRELAKRQILSWASSSSRSLARQARLRVRVSDRVETAERALSVLDSARRLYPAEPDLQKSEEAIREFIASIKVSKWIEMAERAAFKGHYRRAIDRYRDALYYLSRENIPEDARSIAAERIGREIEMLRAQLRTTVKAAPERSRTSERRNESKSGK